jgi:hypothetical protein
MRIDKKYNKPEDCSRFSSCNVNNCRLHSDYPNLPMLPDEKPCPMPKSMRIRFAKDNPGKFKYDGLTEREYSALKKWESRTPEEKKIIRDRLKKGREKKKMVS